MKDPNKNIKPPKWAIFVLRKICRADIFEEMLGDLLELFKLRLKQDGKTKANWFFVIDVFTSFRFHYTRKSKSINIINMFRYNLIIGLRNLRKHRLFSAINLAGLSIGLGCSIFIYLYVQSEIGYDRFHENADRLYRVNQTFIWGDDKSKLFSSTGPGVSIALKDEIPEIQAVTRLHTPGEFMVTYKSSDKVVTHSDERIFAADSNFLELFTFPLAEGNAMTVFKNPNSLVMTASTAFKYFGNDNPLGKMVLLGKGGESTNYVVTGVFEDLPENSYIDFDILLSMNSFPGVEDRSWSWIWTTFVTFVLLDEKASYDAVEQKLEAIPPKHAEATLQRVMGISFDDYIKSGKEWKLYLQPLTDIHLGSANIYNRLNTVGDRSVVNTLIAASFFILLLTCINYMNLKTSQFSRIAKESGIRKLLGSNRTLISWQYFVESFLFTVISMVVALLMAYLIIPAFNQLSGKELQVTELYSSGLLIKLLLVALAISVISGSYPAFLLSAFKPIDVLAGKLKSGRASGRLRNIFVIVQFSISLLLIGSTIVVYDQLQYLVNKDVGFAKDNLVTISRVEWLDNQQSVANEFRNLPGVISASLCTSVPPNVYNGDQFVPEDDQNKSAPLNYLKVDEHYLPTMKIELIQGRNFSPIAASEKDKVILNQSAIKALGWQLGEVLGKKILYSKEKFEVIGVTTDYNFWSLQAAIEPLALFHQESPISGNGRQFIVARIEADQAVWTEVISSMESKWRDLNAGVSFQYDFVEDAFAETFEGQQQFGKSLGAFALVAFFIAGLGLLGMIIYALEQRIKEISIRKVLGSNSFQVIVLMSKKYVGLILLAVIASIPITMWAMEQWLINFEYRIQIRPWTFILSGIITVFFAILIIGIQSFKASLKNPATVLRDN